MHYILLVHKVEGGGIQAVVRSQASSLTEAGHDVTVVCNKEIPKKHSFTFDTKFIAFQNWSGRKKLIKLIESLADVRILAHTFDSYWAMFWLKRYRTRTFNFVHVDYYAMYYQGGKFLKNLERTFNYRLLFNKTNMLFVSHGAKDSMIKKIGIKPKTASVLYPVVDFEEIERLSNHPINDELPDQFYISLGRLAKRKNVTLTIQAFATVRESDEFLVIVGDGEELESLKIIVNDHDLEKYIIFLGWKENPYPILKKAKCLIMSSNIEGFGLNVVEGFSLGVPVVSTDAPSGPNEILGEEYLDCLSKVGSVDDLVLKIKHLNTNINESRFSKACLKEHVAQFNKPVVTKKLLHLTAVVK